MRRRAMGLALLTVALACGGGDGDTDASDATGTTPGTGAGETTVTTTVTTASTPTTAASTTITVQVFFLDEDAFNVGRAPYVVPVEREVDRSSPAQGALDALFVGPRPEESAAGLRFVSSGATGIASIRIEGGTAHVQLAGGCSSGGSTFTVADEIMATLRQFQSVTAVKIYDPAGETGSPDEPGDSIPFCLEP